MTETNTQHGDTPVCRAISHDPRNPGRKVRCDGPLELVTTGPQPGWWCHVNPADLAIPHGAVPGVTAVTGPDGVITAVPQPSDPADWRTAVATRHGDPEPDRIMQPGSWFAWRDRMARLAPRL